MVRALILALLWLLAELPASAQTLVRPDERVVRGVNVREGPGTDTAVIASLRPGQSLEQAGEVPGWYAVRLADGRTGYVSKAWTIPVEAQGPYRVHVIDVATGLAIFVEGPGFTLLYDAGSNDDSRGGANNRVVAYLAKIRPEARRLIVDRLGLLDETEEAEDLAIWQADPKPLDPADVLSIAAGYNR